MSQVTNLNVSPYFDDFDANNDYYKILFKPGYPIQARELTSLQSILQNQIEKFGQHFFKEGAKVIPGNTSYNQLYYAVELNNSYLGVPIDAYVDQLIGSKITGQTSGVTAIVENVLLSADSERGNTTLYVNYLSSSTQNNSTLQFFDGESLYSNSIITSGLLGNTTISAGTPFAVTISSNSFSTGSSFSISEGIYFIRGQFVKVETETLILDQYKNNPSYRVGLFINEEIINSDIDETLNDNSQGFNNYAAPGADRLKITTSLFKKSLDNFDDNNFIELSTIINGTLKSQVVATEYNLFADELARRTYSESGDYVVTPFDIFVKESLNDNKGNGGIFNSGQFTYGGEITSDNLCVYQLTPGKAFVRGYEVETISSTFLDIPKPRTTKTLTNQSINYTVGPTLVVNNVYGSPKIGIGNTYVLSLRNERVNSSTTNAPGKEIGVARVYNFNLKSGSYNSLSEWDISLYDIQTITEITLNEPITLNTPTFIEGKNSGASGFLKEDASSSNLIKIYDTKGSFLTNESFIFDGIEKGYVATAITSYGISDIKSVYGIVGSASTFLADTIQSSKFNIGIATISAVSSGISTVFSPNTSFPGNIVKKDNIISYSDTSLSDPVYAKVVSVGTTSITISGVSSVSGIVEGKLPSSTLSVTDFKILTTQLATSSDNTLYTRLPKNNISSVDLTNAELTIKKSFTVNISSNQLSTPLTAGTNETFLSFDEERYSLIRSDGSFEVLTSDKFDFIDGGNQIQIYNLGTNNTGATLTATLRKIKPKEKIKRKNRVSSIVIDKSKYEGSGIGGTTLNDGLTYGNYPYGSRVQDKSICLNTPDIIEIHGIYESANTTEPSAPKVILSSITGPSNTITDLIIGEEFVNQSGTTIAIVAEKLANNEISFIYKNQNTFKEGESVVFKESNIQAVITTLNSPSFNISFNYTFITGQNGTFYDYGSIARKSIAEEPNKKLKVYFSNGYYESSDDGDITTVNSYNTYNYSKEIQTVNGIRNSDLIDIRPRVSPYTVVENSKYSPFEFNGRLFNTSGNSSANILASDESILTNFSFYLGRIDRIYLSKDGKFQVKYGTPAEKPEKPVSVDDALELAYIELPPYLYSTSQANIRSLDHKRYRMSDIRNLDTRIKNLEYYTSLSLLETNTANLFVQDSAGLNRFKSGFFVDNFTTFLPQETSIEIKNSIDPTNKELRPKHYTTSVDLIQGPVVNTNPLDDLAFTAVEGINVRKNGDVITLDYSEVEWLNQPFATRTESVTPFLINFWKGTLEITPASDTWVDSVRLDARTIDIEGDYTQVLLEASRTLDVDPQTGFSPIVWNSWIDNWTGSETTETTSQRTETTYGTSYDPLDRRWRTNARETITTTVYQDTLQEVTSTGTSTRTGTLTQVSPSYDQVTLGDRTVNRSLITFIRSRNLQFVVKQVKPSTQFYVFFGGVDVTRYCTPKLLEISMISGTFSVGETVTGTVNTLGLSPDVSSESARITFRVAQSNHKEGPYDLASKVFTENPYTNQTLQSTYSSTSTLLNIDTFSLADQPQGLYSGWVESGMVLTGSTSGARATITNVRLVSDLSATLIGCLFITDSSSTIHPKFETGTTTLTLINIPINDKGLSSTFAEENFYSSGNLETVQENILSVRNARVDSIDQFESKSISKSEGTQVVSTEVISESTEIIPKQVLAVGGGGDDSSPSPTPSPPTVGRAYTETSPGVYVQTSGGAGQGQSFNIQQVNDRAYCLTDPLAQSFFITENTGIFLTRCDLFFSTKDDTDIPVTIQLRSMQNGTPTSFIVPFSEVVLDPNEIRTSTDSSVATSIPFKSPIYLEGGKEYCICILSNSTKYNVYISRALENDLLTQSYISNPNSKYSGSLFKSQNASTWEPSQWEDLKFILYRANFLRSGTVELYSPQLTEGNNQIAKLMPNSLNFNSKKVRISLASTINDSNFTLGNTVVQAGSNGYGNYVGNAGIATGSLNIINAGIGYTPSAGIATFNGVILESITGNGRGAIANITISNGVAFAASITGGGSGYQVGDVLGITSIGSLDVGRNVRLSISNISNINEIIVDNIQGEFVVGSANTIQYIRTGIGTTSLNGGGVLVNEIIEESDGLHIRVDHKNHGMYFNDNLVSIYNAQSDVKPTRLTIDLSANSNSPISVESSQDFSTFENVGVGTANPGYLIIGNEIIQYTSVSSGIIGGNIVRGSLSQSYPVGTPVYKYELNGVSLQRINKTHNLNDVTISNPITFDSYHIKLNMTSSGTERTGFGDYSKLFANQIKSTGGSNIRATQNIPFEVIDPLIQNLTVQGTTLSAQLRTVSGKSLSGNEIPFVDMGFEPITINASNYLDTTRIIASKVNEDSKLFNLVGNKSLNMRLTLGTTDTRISPVLDTQRMSVILTSNRVNSVIENYATDERVNSIDKDPTAFQYISKEIVLENSASSIKILLSAHVNLYSDIRAFYSISENPNFNPIFTPFPGYSNLEFKGLTPTIINFENSDGKSDSFIDQSNSLGYVPSQLEYKEYSFTADELPPFRSYRIKLIMTSTNQVYVPRIKDLRVLSLA